MNRIHPDSMHHHATYGYFKRHMSPPMPVRPFRLRPHQEVPESPGWVWFVWGMVRGAAVLALVLA